MYYFAIHLTGATHAIANPCFDQTYDYLFYDCMHLKHYLVQPTDAHSSFNDSVCLYIQTVGIRGKGLRVRLEPMSGVYKFV